jgi:hypothetical protein
VNLGWAWCRTFEGNLEAAGELIERIEAEQLEAFATDPSGQLEVMRAMVAFQAGDLASAEDPLLRTMRSKPSDQGKRSLFPGLWGGCGPSDVRCGEFSHLKPRSRATPHLRESDFGVG